MHVYRRLLTYLRPYVAKLGIAVVCMLGVAALTYCIAWLVKPALDQIFFDRNERMLIFIPVVVCVVFFFKGIFDFGQYYLMAFIGQSIVRDLREQMFAKLAGMPVSFYVRHTTGELLSRMNNDVTMVEGAVTRAVTSIARDFFTVIGLIYLVFSLDFKLALIAMLVFPVVIYPLLLFGRKLRRYARRMLVSLEDITERLDETISGIRIVKAFAMEEYERSRFREVNQRLFNAFMRRFKVRALSNPVMETLSGFGISAIVFYGGYQVINGVSTPGTLFSFITALHLLYEPVKRINEVNMTIQEGVSAAERIFSLMDLESDVQDRPDALVLEGVEQGIIYDDVAFSYEDAPVLKGVTLRVNVGEAIAVVGESGAGKSTLLDLLPRFYDVTGGAIRIDGKDIRELTQQSLRENVGIVTQQTILFDDTVRNNIAYGKPDTPQEKVIDAAKAAHAHEFVSALPEGYDTLIGENGIKLSGGERQRIAIARALLKNPPILVLDEATSNLDTDSEKAVQHALDALMKGRTTLVVAHRLSTIRNVNRIYVLVHGRVVEQGSHDELLALNGHFARLYHMQFAQPGNASNHDAAAPLTSS